MIKIRTALVTTLLFICCVYAKGQSCVSLVRKGDSYYDAGNYNKAKELYQQVINCGDQRFMRGCQERIKNINGMKAKPQKSAPFGVSDKEIVIAYQGGDRVVTISGSGSWRVTVNCGWCKVKKEKGYIIVSSQENEDLKERTAMINVYSGTQKRTIKVINEGAPEMLRSSAENVSFPSEGETTSVDISANTKWEVVDAPSWVKVDKGNGKITLTAQANDQSSIRQDSVKIQSPSHSVIIINIYQGAGEEHLSFSKNDLHFGPDGGDEYVKVYTDAVDWKMGDFPHWCQITRINDDSIKIHCAPNEPINMIREASVNVTTGNQTLGINVSQDAKPMVALIPNMGIGGRAVSFGFSAGYIMPNISASAGSGNVYSLVNYTLADAGGQASYSSSGGFSVSAFADMRLYKNLYLIAGLEYTYYKYSNSFNCDMEKKLAQTSSYYLKGNTTNSFEEEYSMSNLDIPILASYRVPLNTGSHIRINLGPVLNVGLSSKLKLSGRSDSESLYAYKIVNGQMTNSPYDNNVYYSHLTYSGDMDMYGKRAEWTVETSSGNNDATIREDKFDAAPFKRINIGLRAGVGYEYKGIGLTLSYQFMLTNMAGSKFWETDRWKIFDNAADLMSGYSQRNHQLMVTLGYTFRY